MAETIRTILDDPDRYMPKRRSNPLNMTPEEADAFYAATKARQAELLAKPLVAAILDRVGRLTADERTRLHEAWIKHYRMYRTHQSDLWHRAWRRYGEHWRDVLAVEEIVRRAEREGLGPYEGDVWGRLARRIRRRSGGTARRPDRPERGACLHRPMERRHRRPEDLRSETCPP
jgi:hypothetical protein